MKERTIYTRWVMVDLAWRDRATSKDIPQFGYRCDLLIFGDELDPSGYGFTSVNTIARSFGPEGGRRESLEEWVARAHKEMSAGDRWMRAWRKRGR